MTTVPSQCMLVVFHQTLLFSTLLRASIALLNARRTGELFYSIDIMTGSVMFEMSNMENIMNPFIERWKNFHNQLEIKILILLHSRQTILRQTIKLLNRPTFQLYFPSLAITVHNQIDDYTTNQFVSELGGAAGIVLGVSLYTIVKSEFFKLR